jgi:hypothetical protein
MRPPLPRSRLGACADRPTRAHGVRMQQLRRSFVGVRRCPDCNLFMHALGIGGVCIHCDEPLLETELLDDGDATLLR